MRAYKPTPKLPIVGLLIIILAALLGGVVIGGVVFGIGRLIYLIILFPILMGFGGGIVISKAEKIGKVRSIAGSVLGALLISICIYGSYWAGEYIFFRSDIKDWIIDEYGPQDQKDIDEYIDTGLQEETGQGGFIGYFMYQAKSGVTISKAGSSDDSRGLNLGETGSYIYFGIEFLLILGASLVLSIGQTRNPFCEHCDAWYTKREVLGGIDRNKDREVADLLQRGALEQVGAMTQANFIPPTIEVAMESCASCTGADIILDLQFISLGDRGQVSRKDFSQWALTSMEALKFRQAMEQPAEPPQAEA